MPDVFTIDSRIFNQFDIESNQHVFKVISENNTDHIEFSGNFSNGKKDGKGAFIDRQVGDFYYGNI